MEIDEWVRMYGDAILRMCCICLNDYHLAEDAVQETFLHAYQNYAGFRGECAPRTWLSSIAINVCRSMRRGAWFRRLVCRPDDGREQISASLPGDERLIDALRALPDGLRDVVVLHYYQGMKIDEIAAAMKISASAVSMRLTRARAQLKRWILEEDD